MPTLPPTPQGQLDERLAKLKASAPKFARLAIDARIALLDELRRGYAKAADELVRTACAVKSVPSAAAGEEWLSGPVITGRYMRLLSEALRDVRSHGAPRIDPKWIRTLSDGRLAIRVFPSSAMDAALLAKHRGEVLMQPSVTRENLREHQALFYQRPHDGRVCLVLGAGNVNAIAPVDVLQKMFVEGKVCLLKLNPVNDYLGPLLERAFRPALEQGFLATAYGGAEEGGYLARHPAVDEIHITGSDKTHDLMVWGPPGPEADARKRESRPFLTKEITSELGNVSAVIVVPGPYQPDELDSQARNLAGMVANNAGFNCNAARLLVAPEGWSGRHELVRRTIHWLEQTPTRKPWYPGSEQTWRRYTDQRSRLQLIGQPKEGELPFAFVRELDPNASREPFFEREPWCATFGEVLLPSTSPIDFLRNATRFVQEKLWGTLCVTLVVHPTAENDPELSRALDEVIRTLEYGSVAINTWPAAVFGLGQLPWGGHPSSTLSDIQSGRGFGHNTYMLEGVEKGVLYGPVKAFPPSPWFPAHRTQAGVARKIFELEQRPSWLKVPGLALTAVRG